MNMRENILAALNEQLARWQDLLAGLSEAQLASPLLPSAWTPKDVLIHLWAWQQRTIARLVAAQLDRPPEFPRWPLAADPDSEANTEQTNAWIYETYKALPWETVFRQWRAGYMRFIELGGMVSERDLLDSNRYPWLNGWALAFILLASYDHHQEHYDMLVVWLGEHLQA